MGLYLLRRVIHSIFVLWGAVTVVFIVVRLVPGDPAQMMLGAQASAEDVAALRQRMGLDRPVPVQYVSFLLNVSRLELGTSLTLDQPAVGAVASRLPATALLAVSAMTIALALSLPLGTLAALRRGSALDRVVSGLSLIGQAVPSFWIGIMFILIFARVLQWLPSSGIGGWKHLLLPAVTLALPLVGVLTRLMRSGLLEVLGTDFIRTAHAKGLTNRSVVTRHAFRNALIPVITVAGLQFGSLLAGAVIVETVFAWPGAGRLLVDSITRRDYPVVQASVLFITTGFILVNLIVDLSYGFLDPRIRFG